MRSSGSASLAIRNSENGGSKKYNAYCGAVNTMIMVVSFRQGESFLYDEATKIMGNKKDISLFLVSPNKSARLE